MSNTKYNLKERTEVFGKNIIQFAKTIPKSTITLPLISQFIRAGTSVGANYTELNLILNAIINKSKL